MFNEMTSSEIAGKFLSQAMEHKNISETSEVVESFLTKQQREWLTRVYEEERTMSRDSVDRYYNSSVKINGRKVAEYDLDGNKITFTPVRFLGKVFPITL